MQEINTNALNTVNKSIKPPTTPSIAKFWRLSELLFRPPKKRIANKIATNTFPTIESMLNVLNKVDFLNFDVVIV